MGLLPNGLLEYFYINVTSAQLCRCREMLRNSPLALRVLKSALNADEDGQAGIQQLGGDATLLFYQSEEGREVGGVGCDRVVDTVKGGARMVQASIMPESLSLSHQ